MRWLTRLFRKTRSEQQLDAELRFHIERQVADYVATGMPPDEARRRARLDFGGIEQTKEQIREARWETHLDNLFRDFRYALRNLRGDRRFAFIAILALALGIGASTVVFSVVYSVFFDGLPYKNFDRSVVLGIHDFSSAGGEKIRSYFSLDEI
ncbi:MAG: permease prefix domain 1-containing protein, partial [Candidatus Acidiferrum sp.]